MAYHPPEGSSSTSQCALGSFLHPRPPLPGGTGPLRWAGQARVPCNPKEPSDGGFSGSILSRGDTASTGLFYQTHCRRVWKALSLCFPFTCPCRTRAEGIRSLERRGGQSCCERLRWPLPCTCLCLSVLPSRPTRRWRQEPPPYNSVHMGTGNLSKMSEQSISNPLSQKWDPTRVPRLPTLELLFKTPLRAPPNVCLPPTFCSPAARLGHHEKLRLWKFENLICAPVVK